MKISIDLINYLTDKNTWNDFLSEYNDIHDKNPAYANTFAGMLEISRGLNIKNKPYLIIGGLSVASYIHQLDSNAFKDWRGTSDIDLLLPNKKDAESVLYSAGYEFKQTQNTKEGMVGRLYDYVKEDNGEITVVGLREGICDKRKKDITQKLVNQRAIIPVYGVRVAVPKLKDLINMKRFANRAKDRGDIKTLKVLYSNI